MIAEFAKATGVTIAQLRSHKRGGYRITDARHMLHYILVKEHGFSLTKAGRVTNRDHATVHHSCEVVRDMFTEAAKPDKNFAELWEKVKSLRPFGGARGWKVK